MANPKLLSSAWCAIILPSLAGLGCSGLAVHALGVYGWSLFVGLPLLISTLASFLWSLRPGRSFGSAYGMACASLLLTGALLLAVALDGAVCLALALPISAVVAVAGTALGRALVRCVPAGAGAGAWPCLLIALFPPVAAFDASHQTSPPERSVTTRILIHAPAERVWQTVLAFPPIDRPADGIFRLGFAYPLSARIEGSGVGAIRRCTFTTGSFVEPITTWEPPRRLAFDVTSCPEPMQEFSPYRDLHARHLDHYMVSHHGEFRIEPEGGSVLLEGTTWYANAIAPQWYWGPISDYIIHRIHERVLTHIRDVAEGHAGGVR